jgi:hypothetical protein
MITHRRDLYQIIDLTLPAAEIGVAEGFFSRDILEWGVPKLYMVDNWGTLNVKGDGGNEQSWHDRNYQGAIERVAKFGDKAIILRGLSTLMADKVSDNSLGFVNIDCDHSYEGVMGDINVWWPKLVKGGVMAFHDYENTNYGVKQAVGEFARNEFGGLMQSNYGIHLLPEDKKEDAGAYLIK